MKGEYIMISETERERLRAGLKQSARAVNAGTAEKLFLAEDCESRIKTSLENAASLYGTQIFYVPTMKELGEMCGIDVGSSCAVVLKADA
jgi:large subunit ribosomal protein L7A